MKPQHKFSIPADIAMVIISVFMTVDYSNLILAGDQPLRRKFALAVWILSIVGWSIKLFIDLRRSRQSVKTDS